MIMNTPQHTLAINIPNLLNGLGAYSALMSKQEPEMQQKGNSALKIHKSNRHFLLLQLLSTSVTVCMCALSNACMFQWLYVATKVSEIILTILQDDVNN